MNDDRMRRRVDEVLAAFDVRELEQRIAPVKCEKHPDHPDCQVISFYGVVDYGIDIPEN